jgi:hypothetical protein
VCAVMGAGWRVRACGVLWPWATRASAAAPAATTAIRVSVEIRLKLSVASGCFSDK